MAILKYESENELYHHGIKGQKWGVRRFQNRDGSVTAAGAKRYYGRGHNESRDEYISRKTRAVNKDINSIRNHKGSLSKENYRGAMRGLESERAKQAAKYGAKYDKRAAKAAKRERDAALYKELGELEDQITYGKHANAAKNAKIQKRIDEIDRILTPKAAAKKEARIAKKNEQAARDERNKKLSSEYSKLEDQMTYGRHTNHKKNLEIEKRLRDIDREIDPKGMAKWDKKQAAKQYAQDQLDNEGRLGRAYDHITGAHKYSGRMRANMNTDEQNRAISEQRSVAKSNAGEQKRLNKLAAKGYAQDQLTKNKFGRGVEHITGAHKQAGKLEANLSTDAKNKARAEKYVRDQDRARAQRKSQMKKNIVAGAAAEKFAKRKTGRQQKKVEKAYEDAMTRFGKDMQKESMNIMVKANNRFAERANNGLIDDFNKRYGHLPTDKYNKKWEEFSSKEIAKEQARLEAEFSRNNKNFQEAGRIYKQNDLSGNEMARNTSRNYNELKRMANQSLATSKTAKRPKPKQTGEDWMDRYERLDSQLNRTTDPKKRKRLEQEMSDIMDEQMKLGNY